MAAACLLQLRQLLLQLLDLLLTIHKLRPHRLWRFCCLPGFARSRRLLPMLLPPLRSGMPGW